MREKLIDDVHSELMGLLQRTPYIRCEDVNRQYAVNWLMNNGVTVQKWISVKDRLPEGDKVVMCYKAGRGIRFGTLLDATYADGVQAFMDRDRTFAFGVTHWMPQPEPPNE